MTRRRRWLIGLITLVASTGVYLLVLLAVDTWVHYKFDEIAGLNRRGYRGPIAGAKARDEYRIVVLGGSTAAGFGVATTEAFPAQLERALRANATRPVSVVNLGANGEGAYGMRFTFDDYAALRPDLAILYEGYNDLKGGSINRYVPRHESVVFRMTGYFPLLPIVLHEKIMALRYGGNLEAAYRGQKTVFRPTAKDRAVIAALTAAEALNDTLAREVGSLSPDPAAAPAGQDLDSAILDAYLDNMTSIVRAARARGVAVLVVTQPYKSDRHVQQQAALASRIASAFGSDPAVQYMNLGRAVDLSDRAVAWDKMHLTPQANGVIAAALVAPVRRLMAN